MVGSPLAPYSLISSSPCLSLLLLLLKTESAIFDGTYVLLLDAGSVSVLATGAGFIIRYKTHYKFLDQSGDHFAGSFYTAS